MSAHDSIPLCEPNETYTFSFGHHIFYMSPQWLNYYPWLQKMFGVHTSYSATRELDTNLIHYLNHVPPYKIRLMICALDAEMNKSIIQKQRRRRKVSRHLYYLNMMESFLKNGPGCTHNLDILYKCNTCGQETYDINYHKDKDTNQEKIHHVFHRLSDYSVVCTYCGHIWNSLQGNIINQIYCKKIKSSGCNHTWEPL